MKASSMSREIIHMIEIKGIQTKVSKKENTEIQGEYREYINAETKNGRENS